MPVIELTPENFRQTLEENETVFVDFWAPWCGPCQSFAPVYDEVAEQHPDVVFAKVNTEDQQQLAASFNIRSIPTLMIFREQIILYDQAGALPKQSLQKLVDDVKALDMEQVKQEIAQEQQQGDKS